MSRLERKPPIKATRPVWLVICEGKEKEYIDNIAWGYRISVQVETVNLGGGPRLIDDPLYVKVKELKESARVGQGDGDGEVNRVFLFWDMDRVSGPKIRKVDIKKAVDRFEDNGIELILSSPAFEVWLLWHFVDHKTKMMTDEIESLLARVLGKTGHVKAHQVAWKLVENKVDDALHRAKAMDNPLKRLENKPNPLSRMYLLIDALKSIYSS